MSNQDFKISEIPSAATNVEKRRIRVRNAKIRGTHSKSQWAALVQACNYQCVKCSTSQYRLERDHIQPLYQNGCDCIQNIQPMCARCNASKGPESIDYRSTNWEERINALLSA